MATTKSADKLTVLLNETFLPPKLFSDKRISYGTPIAVEANDYDTIVEATSIPGMGYYGVADIHYTRVPLGNILTVNSLEELILFSEETFTMQKVCDQLNAQFGTFLDPVDLAPLTFPDLSSGQSATVTLTAADDSLGWNGSVALTITHAKPVLEAVIGNRKLAVLGWKEYPKMTGRDWLFHIDFTSCRDIMLPVQDPVSFWWNYADYDRFLDVCVKAGIPPFPAISTGQGVTMTVSPTSAVPDSNQAFDKVLVVNVASSGYFYGTPLYFHFNEFDKV